MTTLSCTKGGRLRELTVRLYTVHVVNSRFNKKSFTINASDNYHQSITPFRENKYLSENLQIRFVLKKKKGEKKDSGNQKEIQSADKNSMMHFKFVICRECLW